MQLLGARGKVECSHFCPAEMDRHPCVIYLHGNSSSRLEVFDVLPVLLNRGFAVFCLDLSGSGWSDGEYISLGYHEEKDLALAIEYLRAQPQSIGRIGLWGRSMGASTAILRAAEDHSLAACVLDSAFGDLRMLAEELASSGALPVPSFLRSWALELVRREVSSRATFDMFELAPIRSAKVATCPALFATGKDDTMILPHHTQDLHDAWQGKPCVLRILEGDHNTPRPKWFLKEAADFLASQMCRRVAPSGLQLREEQLMDLEQECEEAERWLLPRLLSPRQLASQFASQGVASSNPAAAPGFVNLAASLVAPGRPAAGVDLSKIGAARQVAGPERSLAVQEALVWLDRSPTGRCPSGDFEDGARGLVAEETAGSWSWPLLATASPPKAVKAGRQRSSSLPARSSPDTASLPTVSSSLGAATVEQAAFPDREQAEDLAISKGFCCDATPIVEAAWRRLRQPIIVRL